MSLSYDRREVGHRATLIGHEGIFGDDEIRGLTEDFLRARFPASFDNSVKTALRVLAHAGPDDRFRKFYKSLGVDAKDPKAIETLRKFWDDGFRDNLQAEQAGRSMLKVWDGFTPVVEEGGVWIKYGDKLRTWLSFK